MGTCVGCGEPLAPSWKFCIHCGIAVSVPPPVAAVTSAPALQRTPIARTLIIGGAVIFVVGVALLVLAIAFLNGTLG